MLNFHLDEHVSHAIADGLRRHGIDVTTTVDAGLMGATDDEHLDFALREQRSVFTNDEDFLGIARRREHGGVVYCAVGARSVGEIIGSLQFLSDELQPNDMFNRIEFI